MVCKCTWAWFLSLISPICLHKALVLANLKSAKRQLSHQFLFALLGSACTKASYKMLVKSIHVVNFINILQAAFGMISFCLKIINQKHRKVVKILFYKKAIPTKFHTLRSKIGKWNSKVWYDWFLVTISQHFKSIFFTGFVLVFFLVEEYWDMLFVKCYFHLIKVGDPWFENHCHS